MLFSLILLTGVFSTPLCAQDWAEKMFNKREHNFGMVARGADTVFRFEITNLYKQTMHITNVSSSCGCTSPSIENSTIKTHEKAYIVAKFNTRTFTGFHGATLTVTFGPPYRAQVQLRVHGNIRGDVVFSPGALQFGDVQEGVKTERSLNVNFAGRDSWQIIDVTNDNDNFEVELKELSRGLGKVSYNLLVRLKDNVPAGYIKDQLTVVTNDPRKDSQRIPLFVEGRIVPEISVTPSNLVLGDVVSGTTSTKKIVVTGKNPFRIVDVTCDDDCLSFKSSGDAKTLHFVEVTFRPDSNAGPVRIPFRIKTDRGNSGGSEIVLSANVLPPLPSTSSQVGVEGVESESEQDVRVAGAGGASN